MILVRKIAFSNSDVRLVLFSTGMKKEKERDNSQFFETTFLSNNFNTFQREKMLYEKTRIKEVNKKQTK